MAIYKVRTKNLILFHSLHATVSTSEQKKRKQYFNGKEWAEQRETIADCNVVNNGMEKKLSNHTAIHSTHYVWTCIKNIGRSNEQRNANTCTCLSKLFTQHFIFSKKQRVNVCGCNGIHVWYIDSVKIVLSSWWPDKCQRTNIQTFEMVVVPLFMLSLSFYICIDLKIFFFFLNLIKLLAHRLVLMRFQLLHSFCWIGMVNQ